MKKILITGASGYIGSCLYFYLKKNYKVLATDKKKNSFFKIKLCNLLNKKSIDKILKTFKPNTVIHLAGQSLVDEKINKEKYYLNNIVATKNLILSMKKNNIHNIIFSSTASVYKYKNSKLKETNALNPISTYAKTKLLSEKSIIKSNINHLIMRFFNSCSALDKPIVIGELHNPETHLIPTLVYKNLYKKKMYVYGNNYKTTDGTCIRDYIHVKDICEAIDKSINYLENKKNKSLILNIGTSFNYSVKNMVRIVEKITKIKSIIYFKKKRKGDTDILMCDNSKAYKFLKWKPKNSNINKIISDEIRWIRFFSKKNIKRKFKNYL